MTKSEELDWKAVATANILQARKKHGRVGKKSRAGCLVCKSRRIKCDENRPHCERCSTTGRRCEYAGDVSSKSLSQAHSPTFSEVSRTSSIERQLAPSLRLRENDKRTFDYFLSWTAPRLGSSLDSTFWCGQVLALAQSEPVILDALLSISILYEHPQFMKTFLTNNEHYPTSRDHPGISSVARIDEHHASALRHYNRSMKTLRDQAAEGKASPLLALLSCLLFTCIEVIRDNVFSALALLTNGIQLLHQINACPEGIDPEMLRTIKQIFVRMSLTSAAFGHWIPIDITPYHQIVSKGDVFASMSDARDAIFALNQDCHRFLQDAAKIWMASTNHLANGEAQHVAADPAGHSDLDILRYGCTAESGATETAGSEDVLMSIYEAAINGDLARRVPPILQSMGVELERRIREWYDIFTRSGLATDDDEAACSLQMLYHVTLVSVAVRMCPTQTAFDHYTLHFREILRLAEIYNQRKADKGAMFTLEVGALAPLWFVIMKCRVPSLRRQALFLLSTGAKKESVFGARSLGEVAVRVVAFEEESLQLPIPLLETMPSKGVVNDDRMPSEEQRMQNLEILVNRAAGRFEIRVTRYLRGPNGNCVKDITDLPL